MSILDNLKRLIFGASAEPMVQVPMRAVPYPEQPQSSKADENEPMFSESYVSAAQQQTETILRAFNESLNIANLSKNRDNKPQEAVSERTSITVGELQNAPQPVRKTVGELQSEPMSAWGNNNIITGLRFSVTMQLRTPLRVLLRHGEIHTESSKEPSQIAGEMWEGIWCPRTRLSERLPPSEVASDIGPVLEENYLPFLIAVRTILEANDPIEHRIEKLREMTIVADWQIFLSHHGPSHISKSKGVDWIIECFFPRFIDTFPEPEIKATAIATRNILKEATALKREKKHIEACNKLREAYSAEGAENLMIEDRLRLPMYLQLAGKNDEGWEELNRLSARYTDQYSLSRIEQQMKVFLRKENNKSAINPVRVILQGDNLLESTSDLLSKLGLDTPNRIAAASDETLLGIKGIGPAKLKSIRDYCAGITGNRDADRLDRVLR